MLRRFIPKCFAAVPLLVLALTPTGCGRGSGGQNTVSGTVTQGGRTVAGSVVFIDGANKEYACPIGPDGKFLVQNLPAGPMKVFVKGTPVVAPGPRTRAAISPVPTSGGVAPNPRYASAAGGLTFTVAGGDQSFDIVLK